MFLIHVLTRKHYAENVRKIKLLMEMCVFGPSRHTHVNNFGWLVDDHLLLIRDFGVLRDSICDVFVITGAMVWWSFTVKGLWALWDNITTVAMTAVLRGRLLCTCTITPHIYYSLDIRTYVFETTINEVGLFFKKADISNMFCSTILVNFNLYMQGSGSNALKQIIVHSSITYYVHKFLYNLPK